MSGPAHAAPAGGATRATAPPPPFNGTASTGELVSRLTEQLRRLVRDEAGVRAGIATAKQGVSR